MKKKRLAQQDIIDYLLKNPESTESEIQEGAWGYYRSQNRTNKKYADILRRALRSKKIVRKAQKVRGSMFVYSVAPEVCNPIPMVLTKVRLS